MTAVMEVVGGVLVQCKKQVERNLETYLYQIGTLGTWEP